MSVCVGVIEDTRSTPMVILLSIICREWFFFKNIFRKVNQICFQHMYNVSYVVEKSNDLHNYIHLQE